MLVVKIDLDKNKENYQAVMQALAAFDIASATWQTGTEDTKVNFKSGQTDPAELGKALSAALTHFRRTRGL